ncbi:DUF4260 domain-containing protein [Thioclava pacifica]|uniref:DUF4260 domain-containing protein n=1 Tax=Thioclava pacifica DSM 10166 TaxID=1353537 RepID=A0A074J7W9_9RHOB|nr:DUF4260 domain-containing protein [Thioclava pacifica]KEO51995.1 hypothetical protein TP2_10995 [Thioclava pacifica DSM 10166]
MREDIAWQRLEGAVIFIAGLALAAMMGPGWSWWVWIVIFFAPDLSMLGYLAGPVSGAVAYNLAHIYGFGLAIAALGALPVAQTPWLVAAGLLVLAHAGFDRMLGYGLKRRSGFQDTHLGRIGTRN